MFFDVFLRGSVFWGDIKGILKIVFMIFMGKGCRKYQGAGFQIAEY